MDQPSMTTIRDNSQEAYNGPEPRTTQAKYLTPTPSGFDPEYDYLSTLKTLSEAAGLNTDNLSSLLRRIEMFEGADSSQSPWKCPPRACIIDGLSSSNVFVDMLANSPGEEGTTVEWMYRGIQQIQQTFMAKSRQSTCVLLAETQNPLAFQVLGTALGLDPKFLLQHVSNNLQARPISLLAKSTDHDPRFVTREIKLRMASLSDLFFKCCVDSRETGDDDLKEERMANAAADESSSFHIQGRADLQIKGSNALTDVSRWNFGPNCISCCRISTHGCK
jgi:hypothetical protein